MPSGATANAATASVWPVRVWRACPVCGSQIRTVPSLLAEASQEPSGATASAATAPVWPVRVWRACPVCGSQIRTVPSSPAEASQEPSGATANAAHPAGVAGEGVAGLPGVRVPDPHRRRRTPAEASQEPSGATANAVTAPVWPVRVWRACPVCGSQIRTVASSPAEASQEPSGATANAVTAPVWPVRVWRACPVCGSQIRTVAVVAGGGQPGAVRGDRQRRHRVGVAGEGVAGLPGVRVPDPHRPVVAGGGQPGAVRGDRQRRHPAGVAGQDAQQGVVRQVRHRAPGCAGAGRSMVARICSRSSSRPVWSGSREANVAASDPGGSSGPSRWAFCRTTIASARARGRSDSRRSDSRPGRPDPLQLGDQPPRVGQHRLQLVAPTRARTGAPPTTTTGTPRSAGRSAQPATGRQQVAVGVDHGRVPLGPPLPASSAAGRRGSRRAGRAGRGRAGSRRAARGRTAAGTTGGPETRVQPPVCAHSRATTSPGIATSSPNTASSRYRACSSGVSRRRLTSIVAATAALALAGVGGVQGGDPLDPQRRQHLAPARRPDPRPRGRRRGPRRAPATATPATAPSPAAPSATSPAGSAGSPAVSSSWASPSAI